MKKFDYEGISLEWLGQSSFRIKKGIVIYIDPYKVSGEKADLILITHSHFDHCDIGSINELKKESTRIVTAPDCEGKVNATTLSPGHSIEVGSVMVSAVHAYNTDKNFHSKGMGVGFILNINGIRIYHAGDTDKIPEMCELKDIEIALLPIGGTYTMDAYQAAEAADEIRAKFTIPMHYGKIVGSSEDAREFEHLVKESAVKILDSE